MRQWGDASVAKVGGKIYAICGGVVAGESGGLSFKCSELAFEMLPALKGIRPAPYLARAKWVAVEIGSGLTDDEVAAYVREAHRLVAGKLPRWRREALGLTALTAGSPQRS